LAVDGWTVVSQSLADGTSLHTTRVYDAESNDMLAVDVPLSVRHALHMRKEDQGLVNELEEHSQLLWPEQQQGDGAEGLLEITRTNTQLTGFIRMTEHIVFTPRESNASWTDMSYEASVQCLGGMPRSERARVEAWALRTLQSRCKAFTLALEGRLLTQEQRYRTCTHTL
jgi:hypothetical protein